MSRVRPDSDFGSAFISSPGNIIKQSGDLLSVTKGADGIYDLNWREPCVDAALGVFIVAFHFTPTGDVPVMSSVQVVPGSPNTCRVNLWFDDTVTGIPTHFDTAFLVSGTRISTN